MCSRSRTAFWRGMRARQVMMGESAPLALWRLTAKNRRRYGGYIVHLGVVLLFVVSSLYYILPNVKQNLRIVIPGATAVVVGLGSIGSEVARTLKAHGLRVIGVSRTGQPVDGLDAVTGDYRLIPANQTQGDSL